MKPRGNWLLLGAVTLLAIAAGYHLAQTERPTETPVASSTSALALMNIPLVDTQGQVKRLSQWHGRILVVNYWATWCFPCREEMPGFSRLQEKYRDKGVQFVGISIDDAAKIIEFQKDTPVSYPLLIGGMTTMTDSAKLGNSRQALPFTVVFDRDGNLAKSKLGRWHEADLESTLAKLVSR